MKKIPQNNNNVKRSVNDIIDFIPTNLKIKKVDTHTAQQQNKNAESSRTSVSTNNNVSQNNNNVKRSVNDTITTQDIQSLRSIGRKSINDFTSEDIQKSEKWARKFYKELGTKSPFFRAWFGDWRANDVNPAIATPIIQKTDTNIKNHKIKNNDTKWYIHITNDVVGDSVHYASKNEKIKLKQLFANIDNVIANAILLDTAVSQKNSENKKGSTQFMHYMYSLVEYNGNPFLAKITVEEYGNETNRRAYNVERIKMSALSRREYDEMKKHNPFKRKQNADAISIANLFSLVKQYDKKFNPKPVNPVMLNDDGTPKVFYHGTPNGTFNVFKDWQYFTDNRNYADVYQSQGASSNGYKPTANNPKTYGVYLTGKKVFDTRKPECRKIFMNEFYQKWGNGAPLSDRGLPDWTDGDDFIEFFEENDYDYDVLLLDEGATGGYGAEVNDRGISYVVKNSNQIKSATDNIGTFDGNNPDTRYSKDDTIVDYSDLTALDDEEIKVYNKRGWTRELFTAEDKLLLEEHYNLLSKNNNSSTYRFSDGSILTEVNNKMVVISGTKENPVIEAVIAINAKKEYEAEWIKELIYDEQRKFRYSKEDFSENMEFCEHSYAKELFKTYISNDYRYRKGYKRNFRRATLPDDFKNYGYTEQFQDGEGDNQKAGRDVSEIKLAVDDTINDGMFADGDLFDEDGYIQQSVFERAVKDDPDFALSAVYNHAAKTAETAIKQSNDVKLDDKAYLLAARRLMTRYNLKRFFKEKLEKT